MQNIYAGDNVGQWYSHPCSLYQHLFQMINSRWGTNALRDKAVFVPRGRNDVNSRQMLLYPVMSRRIVLY